MASLSENKRIWAEYDWSRGGEEWSAHLGGSRAQWFGIVLPRIQYFLPAANILEIACGYGRLTQYLLRQCSRFHGIDLNLACVEHCVTRFGQYPHATFETCEGLGCEGVADQSIDFVMSWDSLVHCDARVLASYTRDIARVLKPGGHAFIHHSNLLDVDAATVIDNHARDSSMSARLMREFCASANLKCLTQELIPWGGNKYLDCFTLFTRPIADRYYPEPKVYANDQYDTEIQIQRNLNERYGEPARLERDTEQFPSVSAARTK